MYYGMKTMQRVAVSLRLADAEKEKENLEAVIAESVYLLFRRDVKLVTLRCN